MNGAKIPSKGGLSTLVRPRFGPGMLLQHEDLDQLSSYTRELNRLMFRSLFGCGVVCGLKVEIIEDCGQASIIVYAGLALNCSGDPIYVPKDVTVVIDENCDKEFEGKRWVLLCPLVKPCAPRTSMCACDEDEVSSTCTRDRDGYEIRVVTDEPKCSCRCEPEDSEHDSDCWCVDPELECYAKHYAGECDCECGDCSGGGCDCVLLAVLDGPKGQLRDWTVDHRVRRFVRPVLMRDPVVYAQTHDDNGGNDGQQTALLKKAAKQKLAAKTVKVKKP